MSKRKNCVSLEDAVEDIMQWVDEGIPELEDDNLEEVYGVDFNIDTNVNILDEDEVETVEAEDVVDESEDESDDCDTHSFCKSTSSP